MGLQKLGALLQREKQGNDVAFLAERPVVLVLDDDRDVLETLGRILSKQYRVVLCATAVEAVEALNDDVCAAVLDVKMREHDGFWACDEIRRKSPLLPVIFYSAYQDAKNPVDIINQHHPFGYIIKGADIEFILDTVERAVRYYKMVSGNQETVSKLEQVQSSMQRLKERMK